MSTSFPQDYNSHNAAPLDQDSLHTHRTSTGSPFSCMETELDQSNAKVMSPKAEDCRKALFSQQAEIP